MQKQVNLDEFSERAAGSVLLDARSEGEFALGHIPGAVSFPILNKEQRAQVGTCYKQKGHNAAVILGYQLVGPEFSSIIEQALKRFEGASIYLHCWRGGLRSKIMGNLLSSAGFNVRVLQGGYQVYRRQALDFLAQPFQFRVLGGYTGAGKTRVLHQLAARGVQLLDIELLAGHRGSSFGNIGLPPQGRQEQFENEMYETLLKLDFSKPVWVEDESRPIGKFQVPPGVYESIRNCPLYFLDYSFNTRCENILREYGDFNRLELAEATGRIRKRLGDLKTREAIVRLEEGDLANWVQVVLAYYDKLYQFGLDRREPETVQKTQLNGDALITYLMSL